MAIVKGPVIQNTVITDQLFILACSADVNEFNISVSLLIHSVQCIRCGK